MTPDPARPPTPGPKKVDAWWSRNWKWVVPVGCLVPVAFVLVLLATVFSFLKSSVPYQAAMDSVRVDCGAQEALGTPIDAGRFVTGSLNVNDASGQADLSIPLRGSRGSGTLYVRATKAAGLWRFDLLELAVAGKAERMDLRAKDREKCH